MTTAPPRTVDTSQISIGILEDDSDQSALLELWLSEAGYDVTVYAEGPKLLRAAQPRGFDLMMLDWIVPEMSGFEVLEWVRLNIRERVPVVFLTTRGEEQSIVEALEAGADDYVVKPARQHELLARVSALARRSGLTEPQAESLEVREFVLDRRLGQVQRNGEVVSLTAKEFDLAWFLFANLSKILSREYLLRHIWNISSGISTRTVDTHISRVRKKLGLRPENGWKLNSVYHFGYRLEPLESE
ncbi:MAG: response regulator transcription factor [Gammaproteobacteria bacterium]|nr:response regulator transcription factor [Gammaproteobacteria bacterium]